MDDRVTDAIILLVTGALLCFLMPWLIDMLPDSRKPPMPFAFWLSAYAIWVVAVIDWVLGGKLLGRRRPWFSRG